MVVVLVIAAILAFLPRWFWKVLAGALVGLFVITRLMMPTSEAERFGHFVGHKAGGRDLQIEMVADNQGHHDFTVTNNSGLLVENVMLACQNTAGDTYPVRLDAIIRPHTTITESTYDIHGEPRSTCGFSSWDAYRAS
jgi:hypothetical protein